MGNSPAKWVWQSSGWYDEPDLRYLRNALDELIHERGCPSNPIATFLVTPGNGITHPEKRFFVRPAVHVAQ